MFTGIVEETGEIVSRTETDDGVRLRVSGETVTDGLEHGQSISVSGACLTVEEFGDDWFETFLAAETVEKTYLGSLDEGDAVNLERALAANDRLDGHFVQGHVDGVAEVRDIRQVGEDWEFEFGVPEEFDQYVVEKGSIALDGISLTVADRTDESVSVAIIPTTYEMTTLSEKSVGAPIHLEVDVIAKYAERMLDGY
ncbi:riboflavin synthase [Natronoarchaeum sp. GCM10025703]|uniref:riboflavin synthase n=1 Tax=unclassified Natronoarchaeum TaxID=2620183 RepID=UPI003623B491